MRSPIMRSMKARRGSTLVMVGVMLVGFVGIGAISADIGRYYVVSGELQTAADAAAIAGAVALANTPGTNVEPIVDSSVIAFVASTNRADQKTLSVIGDSVKVGFWTPGTNGAQGSITYTLNGKRPNAVTVTVAGAPKGTFSQLLGQMANVAMNRKATSWIASLGSNCVRPWAFPYRALYTAVSGITNPPTPAPDLDAGQFSTYMRSSQGARMFTILGQNQTSPQSNDGEWNGFNYTGNAGKASFVDGINSCSSTKINPDAGQGVTLPGQANQYVNWSISAVFGGGNGANAQPGVCEQKAVGNAGCYINAADSLPGVTINSAWGELRGNGSNGVDFNYVGEFVMTCFYSALADVCPINEPGTPNTGYPPGTIVGYIKTLKSRYITPDDILGNFTSNVTRIILVK